MYRGGRMWGMSHSLPSGMDNEFNTAYPSSSAINARRIYNDFSTASNNSLNCGVGTGGGVGCVAGCGASTSAGAGANGPEPVNGTNLIVKYLPQDMTDRELYALFRKIGPISACRIIRDYKTGYSFGYAFVDYVSEVDSQRAIKSLNGITIRNKRLKVSYARPGGESIKDTNLYVTNLPRTITDDQLETIFGKYGSIVQKNILRDKLTGKPRGVAFIRYNKSEEAQEAISALNNIIPEGATQSLTVRLAEDHNKAKGHFLVNQLGINVGPGSSSINVPGYNSLVHRDFDNHAAGYLDFYRKKPISYYNYPYL